MHARAERVGGRLRVDSKPGAGTRIEVTIPVPAPERQEAVAAAD
jgi:signal transduction histidine kinase